MTHFSKRNRELTSLVIRPPDRLLPSEWAERYAYVPPEGNAEPGKWLPERMPWQSAMLDDTEGDGVSEVFWRMASQYSGKTLMMLFLAEYVIQHHHESIIISRDTQDRAKTWARDKFEPTVNATPAMNGLLKEPRQRDSKSTVLHRAYAGGSLNIIGAKSEGAFRSYSAPNIFQDEISAYEATKEGDPSKLIDRGSKTFPRARKLKCSTPTIKGFCRITAGYESGDKQKYFVPCPCCGAMQPLDFFRVKFSFTQEEAARLDKTGYNPNDYTWTLPGDPTDPDKCELPVRRTRDAIYLCSSCARGWTDTQRMASVMSGHSRNPAVVVGGRQLRAAWKATAPFQGIRSRDLEGTYGLIGLSTATHASYLHRWAEEFLDACRAGRDSLMAWWNMFLNREWEERGEKVEWSDLQSRAEGYDASAMLPDGVCWINWAADTQDDRVEILWTGWGDKQEMWMLGHDVLYGDFANAEMQERVWALIDSKTFRHSVLGEVKWTCGAIDSGNPAHTKAVYQWTGKYRMRNVYSVKGFNAELGGLFQVRPEKRWHGIRLNLNVDAFKSELYSRLKIKPTGEPKERCVHFYEALPANFYAGLCSEKRIAKKLSNGSTVFEWIKHTSSTRNEILDMTVYSSGLFAMLKPDAIIERIWKRVDGELRTREPASPRPPEPQPDRKPDVVHQSSTTPAPAQKQMATPPKWRLRIASPFGGGF